MFVKREMKGQTSERRRAGRKKKRRKKKREWVKKKGRESRVDRVVRCLCVWEACEIRKGLV